MSSTSEKQPILLVGGNGFLGTHLALALKQKVPIRTFDRADSSHHGIGEFFPGEISEVSALESAMRGCGAIAYLVHETESSPYLDSDEVALARNLELLVQTISCAERQGIGKVVFFSSGGAVYGPPESSPVSESHVLRPISAYGVAKASMEMYLHTIVKARGFETLIIRPSNPYGPGQNPHRKQGAISVFTHRILKGEPIEVWGDGQAKKDYIFVGDMANAVTRLILNGFDNQAYNVGSGESINLLDLIRTIEETTGITAEIDFYPSRATDVSEITLDITKIQRKTGWQPQTSLPKGIKRTVEWISGL